MKPMIDTAEEGEKVGSRAQPRTAKLQIGAEKGLVAAYRHTYRQDKLHAMTRRAICMYLGVGCDMPGY
jgi:hypothetical protein